MAAADEGRRGFGRETKGPRFLLSDNRPTPPIVAPVGAFPRIRGRRRSVTSDPECDFRPRV